MINPYYLPQRVSPGPAAAPWASFPLYAQSSPQPSATLYGFDVTSYYDPATGEVLTGEPTEPWPLQPADYAEAGKLGVQMLPNPVYYHNPPHPLPTTMGSRRIRHAGMQWPTEFPNRSFYYPWTSRFPGGSPTIPTDESGFPIVPQGVNYLSAYQRGPVPNWQSAYQYANRASEAWKARNRQGMAGRRPSAMASYAAGDTLRVLGGVRALAFAAALGYWGFLRGTQGKKYETGTTVLQWLFAFPWRIGYHLGRAKVGK